MVRPALIILTALVGMFIHPFEPGFWDFMYKLLLFGVLSYLVFENYIRKNEKATDAAEIRVAPPTAKVDILGKPRLGEMKSLLDNDERANSFLQKQFQVMRGILLPDNGWMFYSAKDSQLKLVQCFGEQAEPIAQKTETFEVNGMLKIVEQRAGILLENKVSEAAGVLSWYQDSAYKASSFIGIPLSFSESDKFFITFDSAAEGHFNREDLALLENIRDGITLTLQSRLRGLELVNVVKDQQELLQFAQELNRNKTATQAIQTLADKISEKFQATRLTVSLKKANSNLAVIRHVIGLHDIFPENTEYALDEGLHGWVISKEKAYLIDDLEKGEYFIPRFNREEKSTYGLRSFLGVPLNTNGKTHGSIVLEHSETKKYSDEEKNRLSAFAKVYASSLQRFIHED